MGRMKGNWPHLDHFCLFSLFCILPSCGTVSWIVLGGRLLSCFWLMSFRQGSREGGGAGAAGPPVSS